MRVFVSEYVCGGAWNDGPLEGSLAREGRSMLLAACADFARIRGCDVCTTWDARLGEFPLSGIEVVVVHEADEEREQFDRLATVCDATFVIAPEFEGLLSERCGRVAHLGGRCLGPSRDAIELCADKLRLFEHLHEHGLPTIETQPWDHAIAAVPRKFPFVVKPRDGAGSLHMYLITDSRDLDVARRAYAELPSCWQGICQPYIDGRAMSAGVIARESPPRFEIFPPGEQILSRDGRFRYQGGRISGRSQLAPEHELTIRCACESIPGLGGGSGYVGVDFLHPHDDPEQLLIVEINPRLTTSYLGYRTIAKDNLLERLVAADARHDPIDWKDRAVVFAADGAIDRAWIEE